MTLLLLEPYSVFSPSRSLKKIQKLIFSSKPVSVLFHSVGTGWGAECNMAHIDLSREKCPVLQFTLYNQEGDENCYWDEEIRFAVFCETRRNRILTGEMKIETKTCGKQSISYPQKQSTFCIIP